MQTLLRGDKVPVHAEIRRARPLKSCPSLARPRPTIPTPDRQLHLSPQISTADFLFPSVCCSPLRCALTAPLRFRLPPVPLFPTHTNRQDERRGKSTLPLPFAVPRRTKSTRSNCFTRLLPLFGCGYRRDHSTTTPDLTRRRRWLRQLERQLLHNLMFSNKRPPTVTGNTSIWT